MNVGVGGHDDDVLTFRLTADPVGAVTVQDFSTFVYDLNLLYELLLQRQIDPQSVQPRYATTWILARTGRDIPRAARLRISKVRYGSPLDVVAELPVWIPLFGIAVAALWGLVQTLEKLYNLPENRRLLKVQRQLAEAQLDKLRNDLELPVHEEGSTSGRLPARRPVIDPVASVERRLQRATFHVTRIDIDVPMDAFDRRLREERGE